MSFKEGDSYRIEALANKVYVEAAFEREWVALFIAWAVISYFEKGDRHYGVGC